jgi:hypothetical protein
MSGYFYCKHCGKRTRKNPRLKDTQEYCGQKSCQQARKNKWEREKFKKDPVYRKKRLCQKAKWRKDHKADQYQKVYRQGNPDYVNSNRERQQLRNKNAQKAISEFLKPSNIVKTDALIAEEPVIGGLYEILPCKTSPGQNIVKTDALIVELRAYKPLQDILVSNPG